MPIVVGIRFKDSGKIYFFDPNETDSLIQSDHVIVETVRGPELAKVAYPPHHVAPEEIVGELKPVLRRAEAADFERMRLLNARHDEVLQRCSEKIQEHNLPMRLVKAEYSFDGSRLTFFFTAEKRVDFRMLVRDLARAFRTRIELRQIGPRDEAKLLGGIGPCGRLLCCATFLPDYARVSIKMAKDQDLPLNPAKISGVCGRLLCCLSYEHEQYVEIKAELPRKGTWVQTPEGPGEVIAVNVLKETVIVELAGTGVHEEYVPAQLSEATERVLGLARSRAEEGITPPRPERRSSGEKRLLRNEIDNPEVLDALALLEEGFDSQETPPIHERPARPPSQFTPPTPEPDRHQPEPARPASDQQSRKRPTHGPRPPQKTQPRQAPAPPPEPPAPPPTPAEEPGSTSGQRRRRRRGKGRTNS